MPLDYAYRRLSRLTQTFQPAVSLKIPDLLFEKRPFPLSLIIYSLATCVEVRLFFLGRRANISPGLISELHGIF